jgi:hypothetical protein
LPLMVKKTLRWCFFPAIFLAFRGRLGKRGDLASAEIFRQARRPCGGVLAACFARGLLFDFLALQLRGRREDRVRAAPAVSCANCANKGAHEHPGSAETLRPSLRNGFTAYAVLSPATNSSCHRRRRIKTCLSPVGPTRLRRLDTSNGCQDHTVLPYASAPFVCVPPIAHGPFASPPCDDVSRPTLPRPPHPAPRLVTIAKRPSLGDGIPEVVRVIWGKREADYFCGRAFFDLRCRANQC